jgi:hypothetical protein
MTGDVYRGSATGQLVALQTALWLREECDTTSKRAAVQRKKDKLLHGTVAGSAETCLGGGPLAAC